MKILLVEDNFEHLRLTKYILRHNNVPGEVYVVRDGQEALDYLYNRNQFADPVANPKPHLVLLDLNIPRISGKEVLKTIKADPQLKHIAVVVLSSSDREEDIAQAYDLGAAAYISKAAGFESLNEALSKITSFSSRRVTAFA
ncbi:MAG TPA: response regulator [Bacteroidota bacterium]|nr:response regulator [Bacteroidota bacterium]